MLFQLYLEELYDILDVIDDILVTLFLFKMPFGSGLGVKRATFFLPISYILTNIEFPK